MVYFGLSILHLIHGRMRPDNLALPRPDSCLQTKHELSFDHTTKTIVYVCLLINHPINTMRWVLKNSASTQG